MQCISDGNACDVHYSYELDVANESDSVQPFGERAALLFLALRSATFFPTTSIFFSQSSAGA